MNTWKYCLVLACAACLVLPAAAIAGGGYLGGKGDVVVDDDPPDDSGGVPDDILGPFTDKMADAGKLFGDLYKVLRQEGTVGDRKLLPDGDPVDVLGVDGFYEGIQLMTVVANTEGDSDAVVGGEPVLTVIDPPTGELIDYGGYLDYGWYAFDTDDDGIGDTPGRSPYPAQCVQPVADYRRWGDISAKTGLTQNRLPMVITFDPTWLRSECEIGKLVGEPTVDAEGALQLTVEEWFLKPCRDRANYAEIPGAICETWVSPVGRDSVGNVIWDSVTYEYGVLWTEMISEVHFGRLNLSRAPDAVLQAAFDEAVNTLNSSDTTAIEIDAAGRLLLTRNVYDELLVDPLTGLPVLVKTVKKAIDSPLENMALYLKLMTDGHLVTPGDERMPIDRSPFGGIPLWKMLELEDGPADAALRPTIDIAKLAAAGLGSLVDVAPETYWTYYVCLDAEGDEVTCLCWDDDPVQPELDGKWVACENVVSRELVPTSDSCYDSKPETCQGPFVGIMTDGEYAPNLDDLNFTASFLAAAADKSGHIGVDLLVYLNSILGINKVVGFSEYDEDGLPTVEAIDYQRDPVYFNYKEVTNYDRAATFEARGEAGTVSVLVRDSYIEKTWIETPVEIMGTVPFDDIGLDPLSGFPDGSEAAENIRGYTQQADDDLSVINFVHKFQIPGLR